MALFIPISFERATDSNGNPISGAKRKVFDAGTSNLSAVYTDAAGVTPGANPIISDSSGIFPNRYLADATYDIQFTDASDVPLGPTRQNVVVSASGGGGGGGGGDTFDVIAKTANYIITAADVLDKVPVFRCDASGIPGLELIITAKASVLGIDKSFFVINSGATGTIRIQPDGGETIDGATDVTLTGQGRGAGYVCIGAAGWETISTTAIQQTKIVVSATPSADQTNFTAAGLSGSIDYKQINLAPTASINLNSVAGINDGERITICNTLDGTGADGRLIIIPHEHAASTAANRFFFADRMPRFLMPGESLQFVKFGSRLRLAQKNKMSDGWDIWSDCYAIAPYDSGVSGTGSVARGTTATITSTTKERGYLFVDAGNGGAQFGSGQVVQIAQLGQAMYLARLLVYTVSAEFAVRAGFHDQGPGVADTTDGVYWEFLSSAASQWGMCCAGASSRSKTASAVTVDNNYIFLGIYVTGDWSRADYFLSQDGRTWTVAGSQTGANMPVSAEDIDVRLTVRRVSGSGNAFVNVDIMAHRYDNYRGAAG